MSSKSHNYKKFFRKYKVIIIFSLFFLIFPLLLYMIYRLIYCCYPPFEAGVLLSYYGTTFGIFGSFVTFYLTDKKEKETRNAEIKPKITVDLEKEDEKVFKLTVYNCLQTLKNTQRYMLLTICRMMSLTNIKKNIKIVKILQLMKILSKMAILNIFW